MYTITFTSILVLEIIYTITFINILALNTNLYQPRMTICIMSHSGIFSSLVIIQVIF